MKQVKRALRFTCDWCKTVEHVETYEPYYDLPPGWAIWQVHDCGLTGYTREDQICDRCLTKARTP